MLETLRSIIAREVAAFRQVPENGPNSVLRSAIRFVYNLVQSQNKTYLPNIASHMSLIQQLVEVLEINSLGGDIDYKADMLRLLRVLTERDDYCLKIGAAFP